MSSRPRLSMPSTSTPNPVASRSSWSGQIAVGSINIPVKAYAAISSPNNSALHLIHRDCGQSIAQPRTCPMHGPVTTEDIAKAFQFSPGDDVVLSAADLDSLKPQENDQLRIEHLMTSSGFDLSLTSGRTLFLVPAHAAAAPEYGVVCSLLAKQDLWGIGRVVLNDRSQLLGVKVIQGVLAAFVLHWPQARRGCPVFDRTPVDPHRLRQLAKETLPLRKNFSWDEYQDDYEPRLTELIRAKISARTESTAMTTSKSRKQSNPTLAARAAA